MGIHEFAAVSFKAQEFKLTEKEAYELGNASARVLDLYNIRMTPQQEAWGMLIKTAVVVYTPRVMLMNKRKKDERDARRVPPPAV